MLRGNPDPAELGGIFFTNKFGGGLLLQIEIIQTLHEQEVGNLLDGGERIGDAAAPELVPELVDLAFQFGVVLQHGLFVFLRFRRQAFL